MVSAIGLILNLLAPVFFYLGILNYKVPHAPSYFSFSAWCLIGGWAFLLLESILNNNRNKKMEIWQTQILYHLKKGDQEQVEKLEKIRPY